jgi:hypothetical protein
MAESSPTSPEAAVQKLADDLRTETLPDTILKHLKALGLHMEDEVMGPDLALVFLHAGGLPTLIQHLGGSLTPTGTTDADATASAIPIAAAVAFCRVSQQDYGTALAELQSIPGVITTLTALFRDATLEARYAAVAALQRLATASPTECEGMVEGGVVELVLKYSLDVGPMPDNTALLAPATQVACMLLREVSDAARRLEQAIRSPEPVQAFAALVLFQVCHSCCIFLEHCTLMPLALWPFNALIQRSTLFWDNLR